MDWLEEVLDLLIQLSEYPNEFLVAVYHTPFLAVVDWDRHAKHGISKVLDVMKRRNPPHFRALR